MFNIEREIEEILDENLFLTYHEHKGHCLTEHLLSDKDLRQKLWNMPKPADENDIVMATRFYSREQALKAIYEALSAHVDEIREWRKNLLYPYLEISHTDTKPTGEGICKNTDKNLIAVHGTRVILIANDNEGRAFYIRTAYPVRTYDDVDVIYDAMDEWQERKYNGNKRKDNH